MKYVTILGLVLLALAIAGGGYIAYDRLEQEKREVQQAKQEKQAEDNTVLGQAKQALASNRWTSGDLELSYNDQNKTLYIVDDSDPNSGLDQPSAQSTPRDIVEQAYNLFVRAGLATFAVEGVELIEYKRIIPLNSGSGISTPTEVVKITAEKEKFMPIDWESLKGKPISNTLATATVVQLYPGFKGKIGNINTIVLSNN